MKIIVASDIHGSAYYCRLLMDRINTEKPDRILLLGDILYHGPRNDLPREYNPKYVISLLNSLDIPVYSVRGNCDTEVDQMVLDFPVLADYSVIESGNVIIYATHGHVYNTGKLPPINKNDILLHGHTHVPVCEVNENCIYCNPGSVSIPKENSCHSYMIIENGIFNWINIETNEIYKTYKPEG